MLAWKRKMLGNSGGRRCIPSVQHHQIITLFVMQVHWGEAQHLHTVLKFKTFIELVHQTFQSLQTFLRV